MSKQKKVMALIILTGVVLLSVVGTTVAYFAFDSGPVRNMFSMGQIGVDIIEDFDPPVGSIGEKQVWLLNSGSVDEYVRAMVVPTFRSGGSSQAGDVDYSSVNGNGTIKVTAPDGEGVYTLYLAAGWNTGWHFSSDGNVFYYRKPLASGEQTGQLLDRVESLDDNWRGLEVEVLADGIQAEGEAAADHLRSVWGVSSIDPDDGTLGWS